MPVRISRMKAAPVAAASATEAIGSHSTLTPKGTVISARSCPMTIGHRRGRGCVDLELVGPVVLVAEHHGVEAGGLQGIEILAGALERGPAVPASAS